MDNTSERNRHVIGVPRLTTAGSGENDHLAPSNSTQISIAPPNDFGSSKSPPQQADHLPSSSRKADDVPPSVASTPAYERLLRLDSIHNAFRQVCGGSFLDAEGITPCFRREAVVKSSGALLTTPASVEANGPFTPRSPPRGHRRRWRKGAVSAGYFVERTDRVGRRDPDFPHVRQCA